MKAGFEPAPLRTRALIWRLRPLGHPILSACLRKEILQKKSKREEARIVTSVHFFVFVFDLLQSLHHHAVCGRAVDDLVSPVRALAQN